MDLSTLATAFFTAWTLLTPQRDVQAYQASKQLPPIEQPTSGKFRMEGTLQAGPEGGSFHGAGAFAQPDRLRLALQVAGGGANDQFEMVVIGTKSYVRMGRGEWQVQDLPNQLPSGRGTGTPPRPGEIPPELAAVAIEIDGDHFEPAVTHLSCCANDTV